MKRSEGVIDAAFYPLKNHGGEVSFPGGKRDRGDTSNIVVALREAQEETALNPFDVELMGDLPMQRAKMAC